MKEESIIYSHQAVLNCCFYWYFNPMVSLLGTLGSEVFDISTFCSFFRPQMLLGGVCSMHFYFNLTKSQKLHVCLK